MPSVQQQIFEKIAAERQRQDSKWGEQNHEAGMWSLILGEETGEASKAFLQGNEAHAVTELIEAAAVIVAWIECEVRRSRGEA